MRSKKKRKRSPFVKKRPGPGTKKLKTPVAPRTPFVRIFAKPQNTSEARNRALAALGHMRREKLSLSAACRQEHVKPTTFLRYVGSAVRQDKPGGPFRVTAGDSFKRIMQIPTALGPTAVPVYGSKNAQLVSNYLNAVAEYLRTGRRTKLDSFKGKRLKVGGKEIALITDPAALSALAQADALHFDQLYASATGRG
jgi:hypothetical protein